MDVDENNEGLQQHKAFLSRLCRVCGEMVVLKLGYQTAVCVSKYSKQLEEYYGLCAVENEHKSRFPKTLCVGCSKKLYRLNKKNVEIDGFMKSNHFLPHIDEDCTLCNTMNLKRKSKLLNITALDKEMKDLNFTIVQNDSCFKRVYGRQKIFKESSTIITDVTLCIETNNSLICNVYGRPVDIGQLPKQVSDPKELGDFFTNYHLCSGVTNYEDIISRQLEINQKFSGTNGQPIIETIEHFPLHEKSDYKFLRSSDCGIFISNELPEKVCSSCKSFAHDTLRKIRQRNSLNVPGESPPIKKSITSDTSSCNVRFLSREELIERLTNTQEKKRQLSRNIAMLNHRINEDIRTEGTSNIDDNQHNFLTEIITNVKNKSSFDEESPQWLLWEQQKLQASKKNSKGMRWHPLIIRLTTFTTSFFILYLYLLFSSVIFIKNSFVGNCSW